MKTAIYVEDNELQIVLTPEGEFEENIINRLSDMSKDKLKMMKGEFYSCQGGWIRQGSSKNSLIIRAIPEEKNEN